MASANWSNAWGSAETFTQRYWRPQLLKREKIVVEPHYPPNLKP